MVGTIINKVRWKNINTKDFTLNKRKGNERRKKDDEYHSSSTDNINHQSFTWETSYKG